MKLLNRQVTRGPVAAVYQHRHTSIAVNAVPGALSHKPLPLVLQPPKSSPGVCPGSVMHRALFPVIQLLTQVMPWRNYTDPALVTG